MSTSSQRTQLSSYVKNWRGRKTLAECNLHMLKTEDSCDVTFRCGSQGRRIKAHRYVLISRSCVFHAMFTGPLAETSDVIVPDIEHRFFKEFIVFLYTDTATMDSDNATSLLYAARKYGIFSLEDKCWDFLERNLTVDNACVILETAQRFDHWHLKEKVMTLIKGQGERLLQSQDFLALSQDLVDQIVESDDLVADEHVIFTAVSKWAEAECERKGREVTHETKKSVLGNTLMKVRFPLIKQGFLSDEVKASGLLDASNRRKRTRSDHRSSPQINMAQYNNKERRRLVLTEIPNYFRHSYVVSKPRFQRKASSIWSAGARYIFYNKHDAISFSSNMNLQIGGYQLYGRFNNSTAAYTYDIVSYLGDDATVLDSPVQNSTPHCGIEDQFSIMFSYPIRIQAGEWYTLAVTVDGSDTWSGEEGMEQVLCDDGVRFDFRKSDKSTNNTDVEKGQIPALIYRVI